MRPVTIGCAAAALLMLPLVLAAIDSPAGPPVRPAEGYTYPQATHRTFTATGPSCPGRTTP